MNSSSRARWFERLVAAAACVLAGVLLAAGAWAPFSAGTAGTSAAGADSLGLLERLPASVEAVVFVRGADAQARSAPGRALAAAVEEAPAFAETLRAWERLARTLDWTPRQTFDALLGRRAALAFASLESSPEWALVSAIEPGAAERLRSRLRPAPRGLVSGHLVLAVEDGAFELAMTAGPAEMPGSVTLVLAPARGVRLFDQVLRVAAGEAEPVLAGSPAFAAARQTGVGDVFVLYHRDLLAGRKDPARGAHFLVASATRGESGWGAVVRASRGVLMDPDAAEARALTPWSQHVFYAMSQGAVVLAMGLGPAEATRVLRLDVLAAVLEREGRLAPLLSDRWFLGVWTGLCGEPKAHDAMTVAVGVETPDRAALAPEGDRVMSTLSPLLTGAAAQDFNGIFPGAVRSVIMPGCDDSRERAVSWSYPGGGEAGGQAGWWVVSMTAGGGACAPRGGGETSIRWVKDIAALLTGGGGPRGGTEFLSLGLVRPGEAAALLRASGLDDSGAFSAWRWVDSVTWKTWLAGEFIEGRVDVSVKR